MMCCNLAGRLPNMIKTIKTWCGRLVRWPYIGLVLLVLSYLFLRLTVTGLPDYVFDEQAYVVDAPNINGHLGTKWGEHPPLAKLIIARSIVLFGNNPWGWRLPAICLSSLGVILFYGICRRLTRSHRVAFVAAFLLTFENMYFINGGVAMLDVYLVFFMLLAFWLYLKGPAWWWAAAVTGAMAALCKFSGVLTFVVIGLHWVYTARVAIRTQLGRWVRAVRLNKTTPLASTDCAAPGPKLSRQYSQALLFVCSMLLAPVVFVLLYWVLDYVIWGKWIDVFSDIRAALTITNSLKFSGIHPTLASRPWEWFLSPSNSFEFYRWLREPRSVTAFMLPFQYVPHMSGLVSPTLWLSTLLALPYTLWYLATRHWQLLLWVIWLTGVGLIPAFTYGQMSGLAAALISGAWFGLAAVLVCLIKSPACVSGGAAFFLCWLLGVWVAWIPLDILSDRITYAFYYLPAVGALALGGALLLEQLFLQAEARPQGRLKGLFGLVAGAFLFLHLAVFCILSPVKLTLSIPVALLILLVSLGILGYRWRSLVATGVAVVGGLPIIRLLLYPWLLRQFGVETFATGYPLMPLFWLTGMLIGGGILACILGLTRWILVHLIPEQQMTVETTAPPGAAPEGSV
jgi:dolichyl-phosphate-mannose-protein mannosyltransferase